MSDDTTAATKARDGASPSADAGASSQGETVTTRNWDGWPTAPTPSYLLPEMGKVPVSSTVHFQTVAMTEIGEDVSVDSLWKKLRAPMLKALRARPSNTERRLVVHKATFGDLRPEQSIDVRPQVIAGIRDNTLRIEPSQALFGDPAPGLPKHLIVDYSIEGLFHGGPKRAVIGEGHTLSIPGELAITWAHYGFLGAGRFADVTDILRQHLRENALSIEVTNDMLGGDPAPGEAKQLRFDYFVDQTPAKLLVKEGEKLVLPLGLTIERAAYGFLGLDSRDVTDNVAGRIEETWRLRVKASAEALGIEDPTPGQPKQLRVDYAIDGTPASITVAENEVIELIAPEKAYSPDAIYDEYFRSEPSSLATLASRLIRGGFKPTDFDPADEFASMEDVLEKLVGISRGERLDPLVNAHLDAMDEPAEGVILYHEQGWYGRGLALGNLLHSIALAPGEVTQVAMTNWNHTTRATDTETVSQADSRSEASQQNRAIADIQSATMQQHESGGSSESSDSSSSAFGRSSIEARASYNLFSGLKGSVAGTSSSSGASHTVATAVTHSAGDKSLTMGANQNINALTQRHAEAARTRRAAVVREVTQSEDETLTTRVVANYNHMHALTVMYFEVIEVFSLKTRVVDAERVIFLPFLVRDVRELVPRFRAILVDAANAAGHRDLAEAIRHYQDGETELKAMIHRVAQVKSELDEAKETLLQIDVRLKDLPGLYSPDVKLLRARLKALRAEREAVIKAFSVLDSASSFVRAAAETALENELKPIDESSAKVKGSIDALLTAGRRSNIDLLARRRATERTIDVLKGRHMEYQRAHELLENLGKAPESGPFHDNRLFFNQVVWLSLSSGEVLGLARRLDTFRGERLYNSVDPTPVAVTGNYVGYRWRINDSISSQRFKKQFVEPYIGDPELELSTVSADIAVPTGGVFGEAVVGNGVASEKIDLSRFWNWKDSMIPILPTGINPLTGATPAAQNLSAEPGKLDESAAKFTPLQDLPSPQSFDALAQTMQAQVFRDMSGQSMLQSLADATTKAAASSEQNAAQIASKNLQAGLDFMSDMAAKAMSVAAAPESGGASLLGGMVKSKDGGGASLLGGVLNANGSDSGLLSELTGGRGKLAEQVESSMLGGLANAPATDDSTDAGPATSGDDDEDNDSAAGAGPDVPETELEPKPPMPGKT